MSDETEYDELDDLIDNFVPSDGITVLNACGQRAYLPAPEPMTIAAAFILSGFPSRNRDEYWVNNNRAAPDDLISAGDTLIVVGPVR